MITRRKFIGVASAASLFLFVSYLSNIGTKINGLHAITSDSEQLGDIRIDAEIGSVGSKSRSTSSDITAIDAFGAPASFNLQAHKVILNNGAVMPTNGLGTYSLKGQTCVDSVMTALDSGVRLIDTAYIYGNEAQVGQAVRASDVPREDIFVITKLYPSQFANADDAVEEALAKLDIGYIDMMLLYHPGENQVEAYAAMETAHKQGSIRSLGLSCFYVNELRDFLPRVSVQPALVQNEMHPYYQDSNVVNFVHEQGIALQAWYPLGGRGYNAELLADPVLASIAASYGVSIPQVILRWNLQRGVVVIPGSSNADHIREDADVYSFELSAADMSKIAELNRNEKHDWY